jgi:hypothetical protein
MPLGIQNDNAAFSAVSSIVIRQVFKLFLDTASCLHMMLIRDTGARRGQTAERTAGAPTSVQETCKASKCC